jgi:hypothetical protein
MEEEAGRAPSADVFLLAIGEHHTGEDGAGEDGAGEDGAGEDGAGEDGTDDDGLAQRRWKPSRARRREAGWRERSPRRRRAD